MKKVKRILSIAIVFTFIMQMLIQVGMNVYASEASAFSAVQRAYGSSYPLSSSNEINTARKNIFGKYSKVLGVSAKNFKYYKAARKSDSSQEYVSAIFKATSKNKVTKIKKALKKFVKKEKSSNANYFSSYGKQLLNNAKVGSKGKYVYLFILDTSKNSKAVKAFKKNV